MTPLDELIADPRFVFEGDVTVTILAPAIGPEQPIGAAIRPGD